LNEEALALAALAHIHRDAHFTLGFARAVSRHAPTLEASADAD